MSTVYACPNKDIVCGANPARWCSECPLRAGQAEAAPPPAPVRAFRLTLNLQADNRAELAWALHNMAEQIERDELTVGVSGGPYSGAIYELLHDPAQTHEQYFQQVQEYLRNKKPAA